MPSKTVLRACLLCLLASALPPAAGAYAPVVVVGLQGEGLVYCSEGLPVQRGAGLAAAGRLSWRGPWGEGGFLSAAASTSLDWLLADSAGATALYDQQLLLLQARLPAPLTRLSLSGGLEGSLAGTLDGQLPYLRPDWKLAWRLWEQERGTELELAARGYYFGQPDDEEDSLYQGLQARLSIPRSIRLRYGLLLEAGWELWPEIGLFGAGGSLTGETRHDLVGALEASIGGLAGYFFDWNLTAEFGGRASNANRWVVADAVLEDRSEDRLFAGLRASARFSPHRQVGLELDVFARQELYLHREALTDGDTLSGELLRAFSTGLDLRADWSPRERLFFVLDLSAGWRLANETDEERWSLRGGAGIELRL